MINIENLAGLESINTIPDIILVDNNYGISSPDILSSGVELALRFGFTTLYLPDLSNSEIEKINLYRVDHQDKLKKEIDKVLQKTYNREPNAVESYFKIIGSAILLEDIKL